MSNQENRYFNLYTNGIGYLNRVQEVTPTDGSRFVAVTIAALRGSVDKAQYTYFECRVSGREAQETVRLLTPMVNAKRKVLIGFRLSDLRAETFTFKNGERAGQTGISLKSRLLRIGWAKVDGVSFNEQETQAEAA